MKNTKIELEKGEVLVYDFGNIKVHNYNTKDYISDQVILLEKSGKLAVIESPTFYDNNKELEEYIESLNVSVEGVLLSYHMSGATFLDGKRKLATHRADEYGHVGGGKSLILGFSKTFGEIFDGEIHHVTDYIDEGEITIANIKLNIIPTADAYDIEIPEINSIYIHMLGSNCHSIVAGVSHASAMIEILKGYLKKNYNLILTSHYIPEGMDAVNTKISYLETLLNIASTCQSASEMIEKVRKEYPTYSGENYLEMTAQSFFPQN